MFSRKKAAADPVEPEVTAQEAEPVDRSGRKGRPTPKRRDQEAARRRPLVPADREAAKKQAKQEARKRRVEGREAYARGEERAMPQRDRGPIKRFIRDTVDSRYNLGEFLLPLMIIMLVLTVMPNRIMQMTALLMVWGVVIIGILDAVFLWKRTKKRIRERFHEDPPKGCASYCVMRAMQMRLSRMPRPQIARGEQPR